jgi:hypothetical protein
LALAFLLIVFFIIIAAVAVFVFPPSKWAMGPKDETKKK